MKWKTSELIGPALDWAVAKSINMGYDDYRVEDDGLLHVYFCGAWLSHSYSPSTNWEQGGPIIEQERITIRHWDNMLDVTAYVPLGIKEHSPWYHGPTPLIAAMRCYVASKLGDEVNVPDELV